MRKIFCLLLVFVLILFACSAGCTSSTTKKEVLTQEEFQEVMDARAATSSPTTVSTPTSTPVPTPTSLAPDFKYSVGDVICDVDGENIYTGQIILDYRSTTDEYFIRIIGRDSVHGPWVEVYDYCPPEWKDRNGVNKQNEYLVGHVDVEPTWLTTPTPTATPVPTVTPIRLYWKFSLGDVVSSSSNTNSNTAWVIVDYKDMTDEYYIRTISRTSSNEPWGKVSNADPPKWSGRVTINKQYPYCIGHVDVPSAWRTTSNPTATPVSTTSNQDKELTSAVTSSRVSVGLLLMAVSRDYDQGDYYSMKSDGEKLEQTAQTDYNKISKYRVSSDSQRLKTSYLSALNNAKNIGKYYKMAASEYIKGNDDKGDDYLDTAIWDYNPKYMVDLGVVIQEMGR